MRQFRKRILTTSLALALTLTSIVAPKSYAAQNTNFKDIKGHWAENIIKDFSSNGYISGYSDNTFRPNNSVTRAEFIKIINKSFGFTNTGTENFTDVKKGDWYYHDVLIAVNQGYIDGYGDKTFRPNEKISREEACKIVGVILKAKGTGKTNFKDDAQIASWAKEYVKGLVNIGIIGGFEDNTFRPKSNTTRAESVNTINGSINKRPSTDGGTSGGSGIISIEVENVSVIDNKTIKITMPKLEGLTFKWNGSTSGLTSSYDDKEKAYILTVPTMTNGVKYTLEVSKRGYISYKNENIICDFKVSDEIKAKFLLDITNFNHESYGVNVGWQYGGTHLPEASDFEFVENIDIKLTDGANVLAHKINKGSAYKPYLDGTSGDVGAETNAKQGIYSTGIGTDKNTNADNDFYEKDELTAEESKTVTEVNIVVNFIDGTSTNIVSKTGISGLPSLTE